MGRLLYDIGIRLLSLAIFLMQPFSHKARLFVAGRRRLPTLTRTEGARLIWIHAASLGEFEQGRPIIEFLREHLPRVRLLLTFYSPSGYEVRKSYGAVDAVAYMPIDTRHGATEFIRTYKPDLAVFIKYEIWYHHLRQLERAGIAAILVSAQLRTNQVYFKRAGHFLLHRLRNMKRIFVTNERSHQIALRNGLTNSEVSGDTRVDRVVQIAASHHDFSFLAKVLGERPVLVAGSTWPRDEQILQQGLANSPYALIIAPHVVNKERINEITRRFAGNTVRLSHLTSERNITADLVIVDTMGELAHIYHIADISYVGGGFNSGIHNILEPVAYRVPVLFGPNHHRFDEAHGLKALQVAQAVRNASDVRNALAHFSQPLVRAEVSQKIGAYLAAHAGATKQVCDFIMKQCLIDDGVDR